MNWKAITENETGLKLKISWNRQWWLIWRHQIW